MHRTVEQPDGRFRLERVEKGGLGFLTSYEKDGRFVRSWNLPWLKTSWQAHLAVDSRGTVYVSYPDGGSVLAFDKAGAQRKAWTADDSGAKLVVVRRLTSTRDVRLKMRMPA